jgi:hypothetical protein
MKKYFNLIYIEYFLECIRISMSYFLVCICNFKQKLTKTYILNLVKFNYDTKQLIFDKSTTTNNWDLHKKKPICARNDDNQQD